MTSGMFAGPQLPVRQPGMQMQRGSVVKVQALFKKKAPMVVEEPPAPVKKSMFSFGGKKDANVTKKMEEAPPAPVKKGLFSFGGKKEAASSSPPAPSSKKAGASKKVVAKSDDKAAEYKKRQGLGGIVSAFDFAEVRSKSGEICVCVYVDGGFNL